MEIGQKLKNKRTALGLTQEQLAAQLGVARQTVANAIYRIQWSSGEYLFRINYP